MMKIKMSDFLADCAERIILLGIIHRRVMNRYVNIKMKYVRLRKRQSILLVLISNNKRIVIKYNILL